MFTPWNAYTKDHFQKVMILKTPYWSYSSSRKYFVENLFQQEGKRTCSKLIESVGLH